MGSFDSGIVLPRAFVADSPPEFSAKGVVSALLDGEAHLRAHLDHGQIEELQALEQESDCELFWRDLISFAGKLETAEKLDAAAILYASVGAQHVEPLQRKAQVRLDAIQGKGAFGGRSEFLLNRFTRDAADPKVILPMLAGSLVYGATRAATLSRLAASTRSTWYTQGFAARLTAASVGFAAEVPTFALGSRLLRQVGAPAGTHTEPSLGHELASAAITLGFLKSFSFAGNQAFQKIHGIGESGAATRLMGLAKASPFAFSQASMFTGLLAAHKVEERLGLRPHVDGATTITDTLASMLSLSIGAHLGHKVLGPRFGALQREMQGRTALASRALEFAPGLRPLLATPNLIPSGILLSLSTGSGRRAEPSSGDPSRIIREHRIDLSAKDAKPKARRKALEDLKNHLMTQLHGDPCIPEGAKALRELFEDPDDAIATAAMEHYGTLFLIGFQFGPAETRQGQKMLEKIRDNAQLITARRKKADLALTYIEGGMELNDTANFRHLEEATQPLPEERAPRAINTERLFQLVLPTQLRKLFLDPNASEAGVQQTRQRYLALMRTRPVDLRFDGEMLELRKRFGGLPDKAINLETTEAQNAALTFIELAERYTPDLWSSYDVMTVLRRIFSYDGHTRPPQLLHSAFLNYSKLLNSKYFEKSPEWWHRELAALHEIVKTIHLVTVQPPSPWARKGGLAADIAPDSSLDHQTDIMILKAYANLLRPLPTTHPTLAAGMHMLDRLSRRRAGVEPMKTNYIRQLLGQLREEKIRSLPETLTVKGWGTDPRNGKPIYVERELDPRDYQIREIQTSEGPGLEIIGTDLHIRLPKAKSGGGSTGSGLFPLWIGIGLGLEQLLNPHTAFAADPLDPILSWDLNTLVLGAVAAVSAALGFWAGWQARRGKASAPPSEVGKLEGSIYRMLAAPQGVFNILATLNPKRLTVTAFHENGQPREVLFTKSQTVRGIRFSAGITAVLDADGRLLRMNVGKNPKWYDAAYDSFCEINGITVSPEAQIFFTPAGDLDYVKFPSDTSRLGAYYAARGSRAYFHENGKIKALVSQGYSDDPLKGSYKDKYVFFDQNGAFLGAGEQLSDYYNYVKVPERRRITDLPEAKGRLPATEAAAQRENEAAEREAEAAREAEEDKPGKRGTSD